MPVSDTTTVPDIHTIAVQLPWAELIGLVLLSVLFLMTMLTLLRRAIHAATQPGEERDWSVPPLSDASGCSLFHGWDVRCKIVTLLSLAFMIASLGHFETALCAVGFSVITLFISRASLAKVLTRLLAIMGFITMFLVIMPFSAPLHPGDTAVVINNVTWAMINLRGLLLAATIAAKAVAITLLMEPLLSTAPLPVTLHGLSRLGVPEMVGQMILLSHRYLHVFRHEARRIAAGMTVRGFHKRTDIPTLYAVANFLGMLFVRSFERTERVFDAMQARGYRGRFPDPVTLTMTPKDLALSLSLLICGLLMLFIDYILI